MNPASPRWQIVLGTCACAAAGAYVYAVDPAHGGYPQCLLYNSTGYYCAGCGATRACHALLHGRLLEAAHDNLLFMILLPLALTLVMRTALAAWRMDRWPSVTLDQRTFIRTAVSLAALALLFMTLRNLPGTLRAAAAVSLARRPNPRSC
jgi:hypothetical protein